MRTIRMQTDRSQAPEQESPRVARGGTKCWATIHNKKATYCRKQTVLSLHAKQDGCQTLGPMQQDKPHDAEQESPRVARGSTKCWATIHNKKATYCRKQTVLSLHANHDGCHKPAGWQTDRSLVAEQESPRVARASTKCWATIHNKKATYCRKQTVLSLHANHDGCHKPAGWQTDRSLVAEQESPRVARASTKCWPDITPAKSKVFLIVSLK